MTSCPKCGRQFKGQGIGSHAVKCGVTPTDLFRQKVDKSAGPDACWPWTGSLTSWRYGHFNTKHKEYMAHRLAWELANGPIPAGRLIMHTCDNPPCCNPAHLVLGTNAENMDDMHRKGRGSNGCAKITRDQVREIRAAYKPYKNARELAAKYGLALNTISNIVAGRSWRHVK